MDKHNERPVKRRKITNSLSVNKLLQRDQHLKLFLEKKKKANIQKAKVRTFYNRLKKREAKSDGDSFYDKYFTGQVGENQTETELQKYRGSEINTINDIEEKQEVLEKEEESDNNESENNGVNTSRKRKKKPDPFAKEKQIRMQHEEQQQQKAEAKLKKQEELKVKQKERDIQKKKLLMKTKRGQPIMDNLVKNLLTKIEKGNK